MDTRGERVPLLINQDEKDSDLVKQEKKKGELTVILLMVIVVAFGSLNTVARKIMTVPMGNYSFFLALFNGVAYLILYPIILFVRYKMNIVPKESILWPWKKPAVQTSWWSKIPPLKYFVLTGLLDGLGSILQLLATPHVLGPLTPLLGQTIILFLMICALIILKTRYTYWQCFTVLVVVIGTFISLIPDVVGKLKGENSLLFSIVLAISGLPFAMSYTIKELVFKEKPGLDLFVLSTHTAIFQLLFYPLFVPISVLLKQTGSQGLIQYIRDGFSCFIGITPDTLLPGTCSPDPYPYLVYIAMNIGYNIALLWLLKIASALQTFMASTAVLPVSVLLFYFKWPLLGRSPIDTFIIIGLVTILVGLVGYRLTTNWKTKYVKQSTCCSCFLPVKSSRSTV
jgi:hypothetical protein